MNGSDMKIVSHDPTTNIIQHKMRFDINDDETEFIKITIPLNSRKHYSGSTY